MFRFSGFRQAIALVAGATLAIGVVTIQAAGPATAGGGVSEITSAGPGPGAGTILVTFNPTFGPYVVEAYDREVDRIRPTLVASAVGNPAGTLLTGLEPSTVYWVYVVSDGSYSLGRLVMSSAAGANDVWMQAYGRHAQADLCDHGWWPSYAEWPNAGRGGWTCDRYVSRRG